MWRAGSVNPYSLMLDFTEVRGVWMDLRMACGAAKRRERVVQQAFAAVWRNAYVRALVTIFLFVVAFLFLWRTRQVWFLAVAAFLIAYLVYPLLIWSQRRFHARWLGLVIFFLALGVLVGLIVSLVIGLVQQVIQFSQTVPELVQRVTSDATDLPRVIRSLPLPPALQAQAQSGYRAAVDQLGSLTSNLLEGLGAFVTGGGLVTSITAVTSSIIDLIALLALTVYILLTLPQVTHFLVRMAPKPYQGTTRDVLAKFEHAVGGYFRGQLVIASFVGVVVGAGFYLLGIPLALSLGFLAGVFNLVPYLGVIVSTLPALLLALSGGWWQVVGVLAVVTVANQLETHILSPLVLGRSTKLHPAVVIIAIFIGASLSGIWGALIAVPLAAFAKLLYEDYYQTSRFYENG